MDPGCIGTRPWLALYMFLTNHPVVANLHTPLHTPSIVVIFGVHRSYDAFVVTWFMTGLIFADRLLLNGAVAETLTRLIVPGYRERIIRHEAGHFLVAYLLGCPVQGCLLDPFVVSVHV